MLTRKIFSSLLLVALLFSLCSCTQVTVSGRSRLNLVSNEAINQMSADAYREFLSKNKISDDKEKTQMVKRVGLRIQLATEKHMKHSGLSDELSGYEWEFNLIEDDSINAWAMPGGKVVVFTGIFPVAKDETGLAVVMGHEIAHAVAKHGAERMSHSMLVELGGAALSKATQSEAAATRNIFNKSYSIGTSLGIMLPYSRVHETEADHLGLVFMAMAGYDPREAASFWQRMSQENQTAKPPAFLSTHPSDYQRIQNIQSHVSEAMVYYNQSKN